MKLVIDTNVLISGIFWKGPPNQIVSHWLKDGFEVFISESILTEYEKVLKRMKSGLTSDEIREWIKLIISHSYVVKPLETISIIEEDPDDDKFILCGVYGSVDYIVSGDKHLLNLSEYEGIKIVSPSRFLEEHPEILRKNQ